MKKSEFEDCAKNGVTDIIELKIGFDGIVIANSKKGPAFKLTRQQLFLALAKEVPGADGKLAANTAKNWNDIDPRSRPRRSKCSVPLRPRAPVTRSSSS
nr:substrate-binding domain-containing protein [Chenggangzhangella methanolivorans]